MKKIIYIVIGLAVVGGGSFYAGLKYDQNKTAASRQARFGANVGGLGGARGGRGGGGGFIAGEILSKDDESVTLKLRDGGSKIIFFSDSTQITKSAGGSAKDLAIGQEISAAGETNSDGSVNAQTIQIRAAITNTTNK